MSFMDIYLIVPNAFVSGMIWFVLLAVLLYIARDSAHQAIEYLDETGAGHKTILVFSDLKEELREGYVRAEIPLALSGYSVVALNVTKLRSDNVDPREYLGRLNDWKQRVETGGGRWKVVNNLERLESLLEI